jgi:hypothetical protein
MKGVQTMLRGEAIPHLSLSRRIRAKDIPFRKVYHVTV